MAPGGVSLPALAALLLYGIIFKVTRDCLVRWWEVVHERFAHLTPLGINLDHGPEDQSRRTPCRRRMVNCAHDAGMPVRLAYDPPSHSKYNPIERCWGSLENP